MIIKRYGAAHLKLEKYGDTNLETDVNRVYTRIINSRKYQAFRDYRDELDDGLAAEMSEIRNVLGLEIFKLNQVVDEMNKTEPPAWRIWLFGRIAPALSALLMAYAITDIVQTFRTGTGAPRTNVILFGFDVVLPALVVALLCALAYVRHIRQRVARRRLVSKTYYQVEYIVKEHLKSIAEEATTRVINNVLGPRGLLRFPTEAPRLVELSTSKIVPSASTDIIKEFIGTHESSAIGVSGPRGSGKTTLMKAIKENMALDLISFEQSAPVRYDSAEFIRRLALNICTKIGDVDPWGWRTDLQDLSMRKIHVKQMRLIQLWFAAFAAGTFLVAADAVNLSQTPPFDRIGRFGWWGLATITVATLALFVGLWEWMPIRRRREARRFHRLADPARTRARHLLAKLTYESESSTANKGVLGILGGSIGVEREESRTQRERVLSSVDIVGELRYLLEMIGDDTEEGRGSGVLIVIDELDKISEPRDLVSTINDLKDLFHIPKVHFLVSVSTDALRSFEQRGLPARDAFDSSFDVILGMQPLDLQESLAVISARAEGFPPLVGAFCHAWSGGLPRELLRVARRCVQLQRDSKVALPVELIVSTVMIEDITSAIEARMRTMAEDADGDVSADSTRAHLWALRRRAQSLKTGAATSLPDMNEYPDLEPLSLMVLVSEAMIYYYARLESDSSGSWSSPDLDNEALDAVAKVVASRGDPLEFRKEAMELALARFSGLV